MSKAITYLRELAQNLQTQDNHCTASPAYCIQELTLITGIDEDYTEQIGWFSDGEQADEAEAKALEDAYIINGNVPDNWTRTGYDRIWHHTGVSFLTEAAAEAYCQLNGHRHRDEIRVYVDSHYRNPEMRELRRLLAGPVSECVDALRKATAALILVVDEPEIVEAREAGLKALASLDAAKEPHQ